VSVGSGVAVDRRLVGCRRVFALLPESQQQRGEAQQDIVPKHKLRNSEVERGQSADHQEQTRMAKFTQAAQEWSKPLDLDWPWLDL
jgi:hypothetical protein